VRDSPALDVAARLAELGASVLATDPEAIESSRRMRPTLDYVETVEEAVAGADAVLVLTEWREYRELDPEVIGALVRTRSIVDGRNCLDREAWRAAGWEYRAPGRPQS